MQDDTRRLDSRAERAAFGEFLAASDRPPASVDRALGVAVRPLASLPDDLLLERLREILGRSRRVEAELVAHMAEVDERRLWAREAFPSMFAWCTEGLHLCEGEAWLRLTAARASRAHPPVLAMLAEGRLHLSGIALLAPHLTAANREAVLQRAAHRTKRQIEELVAGLAPQADAPARMRRLPERAPGLVASDIGWTAAAAGTASEKSGSGPSPTGIEPGPAASDGGRAARAPIAEAAGEGASSSVACCTGSSAAAASRFTSSGMGRTVTSLPASRPTSLPARSISTAIQPLAPGRYRVQFTASAELCDKLDRLRALMRSEVPDGDLAAILDASVTEKLQRLEARRFATTSRPRKSLSTKDTSRSSRRIPAAVRREVHVRDGGRCRYVDTSGRRCEERRYLQYHHVHPFGVGGDHRPENVRLMCPAHNARLAEHDYGGEVMARFRRAREPRRPRDS